MVKKFLLICLVGLLGIAVFASPAWGYTSSSTTVWIAQMDTSSQTTPSEQPSSSPKAETSPVTEQTTSEQTATDQEASSNQQRANEPFNPYDMKALKQFDAGDHRAQ
ncbi:MAG: hypothetical protein F6K11_34940 [Leptolyngbya sp. SIO3F4]|nr:hypothetical protein [Leptolyngbya sp. SIO3F4]